jgi:hypothetical protein
VYRVVSHCVSHIVSSQLYRSRLFLCIAAVSCRIACSLSEAQNRRCWLVSLARICRVYPFCIVIVSNLYHCSYRSPMTHNGYNCDTHRYAPILVSARIHTYLYPIQHQDATRYTYRHVSACIIKCITTRYRISVSSDTIFVSGVYQKRIGDQAYRTCISENHDTCPIHA